MATINKNPAQLSRGYNTKQAAEFLGLSPRTLNNWRSMGRADQPAYVRLGKRKVVYLESDLQDYIAKNTHLISVH